IQSRTLSGVYSAGILVDSVIVDHQLDAEVVDRPCTRSGLLWRYTLPTFDKFARDPRVGYGRRYTLISPTKLAWNQVEGNHACHVFQVDLILYFSGVTPENIIALGQKSPIVW
ncbi:hypothetical protein J6590_023191, partial [Homalodisca vitripennis]